MPTPALHQPADDESLFLTTEELSRVLKVPVGTLRQWRHRRYGPRGFRVGNAVLYRRTVVESWLDERELAEQQSEGRGPVTGPDRKISA